MISPTDHSPFSTSRAQVALTSAVVLIALAGIGVVRLAAGDWAVPPELELLLGFVMLGGLSLLVIDLVRRLRAPSISAAEARHPGPTAARASGGGTDPSRSVELDWKANGRAVSSPNGNSSDAAFLRGIVLQVGVGVIACDPQGRVTLFNQAARQLHGIPEGAPLTDPSAHYELYARDGVTRLTDDAAPLARALRGETLRHEELMIASRNGWARTVTVNAEPLLDGDGLLLGAFATVEDVTDRQRTEQDLRAELERAKESDRLKSSFLANMSHEIRTPLNIILGYNTMVAEHLTDSGDTSQQPLLDAIGRASRRLMNTVHGILDIARIEVGAFQINPVALKPGDLIQRILLDFEEAAANKGITLDAAIEEPGATILCDEHCFSRALEHLVDNAIKFTEQGGVTVCLHRDRSGVVALEVRDTGVGIDPQFIPHLFQPFSQEDSGYTRRFEGSGIGLALVKNYVEFNNADVSVESEKGIGSVFRIRFLKEVGVRPPSQEAPVHDPTTSRPPDQPTKAAVLVVEDDLETQGYMKALLGRKYEVLLAASGEEARRQLAAHPDTIRVILMDLSLKGEEDGLMLTRSLRQHPKWKDVAIIATTAHAFLEDQHRALAAGCDAFLAKPFSRDDLLALMERLAS
jgi:PAS domain S-box-containing protein